MCTTVHVRRVGTRLGSRNGRVWEYFLASGQRGGGGGVSLISSSEISARASNVFPNKSTVGEDFSHTSSSVNCGLQRKNSSEKVVSRCSNTIIRKNEFLNTTSIDGDRVVV